MQDLIINIAKKEISKQETLILDADSTYIVCNGNQEENKHNVHYNNHGFHPLIITEHNSKMVLSAKLRSGNKHCADGLEDLIAFVFNNIDLSEKQVLLRADFAFCNASKIDLYEHFKLDYAVKMMRRDKKLGKLINEKLLDAVRTNDNYEEGVEYFGQITYESAVYGNVKISYKATTAIEEQMLLFPEYQIIISNIEDTPENIFGFYNQRVQVKIYFMSLKAISECHHYLITNL